MLIVKEETMYEGLTPEIKIDEYIPFTIELGTKPHQLLYWRGGDGKLSLIEVGLDRTSGAISSAALISINSKDIKKTDDSFVTYLPESDAIAVFDLSGWKTSSNNYSDSFQDEFNSNISLVVGSDYLTVTFSEVDSPSRYIKNDKVRLGISPREELSTLEIIGLTPEQVDLLKQNL